MTWLTDFRTATQPILPDPFLLCLAESIATVESAAGRRTIITPDGLNEIGYKAIPGHPSVRRTTHEDADAADPRDQPVAADCAFRLFRDRGEQAAALAWLLHGSAYYEAARLLFVLAFYAAYAPGRTAGARELLRVFNRLAASGAHAGVRPFTMPVAERAAPPDTGLLDWNHTVARRALQLFAALTASP